MSSRLFMALGLALAVCMSAASAQEDTKSQTTSGKFNFRLRNGTEMSGYMTEQSTINLLVAGLELKVPVPLVESIRFDNNDMSRIRMQLNNGDSLSGQIMPSQLGVMADWGTLKINSQALVQVSRVAVPAPRRAATTANTSAVVPASPASTGNNNGN